MRASRIPAFVLGALVVALAAAGSAQDKPDKKAAGPKPVTVEELVADLGHPVYGTREKAQRELWKHGDAAIPALEKALTDNNPEVARRAKELLDKLAWGVRPDTPPAVLKLLKQFQAGDADPAKNAEVRKAAILELLRHGPAGMSVARALLGKDLPPDTRAQLVAQITTLVRREVPLRLFDGKVEEAAELVALHAAGTAPEGAADFAAFHALKGDLPAAIAAAEAGLKGGKRSAAHKLVLAHLYRAAGDWPKAREMAADMPRPENGGYGPVEALREDAGDWAALVETPPGARINHLDAVRLTMLRLAGRQKELDAEVARVKRQADEFASPEDTFEAAIALYANHRAADATKILLDRKHNLGLLAEVLAASLRYQDALDFTPEEAKDRGLSAQEKLDFDLRRARVLMLIGKRDEAVQLFGKVAEGLRRPFEDRRSDPSRSIRSLLRAEMRSGLKDLAAEHAALFLTTVGDRGYDTSSGESPFEILFGQDSTAAEALFSALREKNIPGAEAGRTMTRVRDLLTGKAKKEAVDEAIKALRDTEEIFGTEGRSPFQQPFGAQPGPDRRAHQNAHTSRHQLAIAAVCRAANRDAEALAAFKAAADAAAAAGESGAITGARSWAFGTTDTHRPWVEWGDFLYDRGRFREAAVRYEEGWRKFPEQPVLMFLSGKALAKAGDVKEGERRMELAHWVSLGQERLRGRFLDDLVRRGEGRAARREAELLVKACWCRDHFFGNAVNQAAKAAALAKDFETAELCSQRSLLVILRTPNVYYVEVAAYMVVPHELLVYRARARLAAGKTDEAMALAKDVLAVTPGHVDLVSGMVPELDRLGKKAEADELFGTAWAAYRKVLADFPESPSARNSLASLAAACGRELDKGLAFAEEAVKADPASVPFRETLAEVHFRRGDRDKAVEVMTKLAEEDPRNRLFKRQLARYRTGAIDSPKPEMED